jgi:hypothetical protein
MFSPDTQVPCISWGFGKGFAWLRRFTGQVHEQQQQAHLEDGQAIQILAFIEAVVSLSRQGLRLTGDQIICAKLLYWLNQQCTTAGWKHAAWISLW